MLDKGVLRVEQHQLHERGGGAGRREPIHVVLLDHFQVLLPVVAVRGENVRESEW